MLEQCYPQDKSLSSRQALGKLIVLPNGWNFIRWIALFTFWTTEASYSQGDFTFLCTKENWIKIWLHVPLFLLCCLKVTATIFFYKSKLVLILIEGLKDHIFFKVAQPHSENFLMSRLWQPLNYMNKNNANHVFY